MSEWIPVKEKLPNPEGQAVLVYGEVWVDVLAVSAIFSYEEPDDDCIPFFEVGYYFEESDGVGDWQLRVNEQDAISHWMPLPEAP